MPGKVALTLVWDAHRAGEKILRFVEGRTYQDYIEDDLLRSAVERQFEILGEAFTVLRREFPDTAATIVDMGRAIAFRNLLIHGYATIDNELVWRTIETDLPGLVAHLAGLLAEPET